MVLTAIDNAIIIHVVMLGERPPLDAITGPADLVSFAMRCIPLCWHQLRDQRPSFDGEYCVTIQIFPCLHIFVVISLSCTVKVPQSLF